MRIAFVTDVHFGPQGSFDGRLRKLTHLAEPLLREFVTLCNEQEHPDLIVNLGDVVQDATREQDLEEYGRCLEILRAARAPVLHVAGNHDLIHLTDDDLRVLWGHSGPLFYSRDLSGLHLAVLLSVETTGVRVHVPDEQIEWLARDLAQTELPSVVLIHHPLADMNLEGNRWFERNPHLCLVENRHRVREAILASRKVVAVFNGHAHWHNVDLVGGIPFVTLQSLTENLDDDAPGRPARAAAIADIDGERLLVRVVGAEPRRFGYGPA
jgi:3',5'-cyclic AMP phosphodiesterase CpdA